jgi:adenylylsulfate kinase
LAEKALHSRGCSTYVFDGDNVRHGLCEDLGFSAEDRSENIRRIGEMIRLFVDAGMIVLSAFISPQREDRRRVRDLLQQGQFFEIFVECPTEVCAQRDTKGIYAKAKAGLIKEFTGISAPYEPPEKPDLVIQSHKEEASEAAKRVIRLIEKHELI